MKVHVQELFRAHNGWLRMHEALSLGISRYQLYTLRDKGILELSTRGLFRLKEYPYPGNYDLVAVSKKYPNSVICLISALSFHEITTEIPHVIHLAIARSARIPKSDWPPIEAYRFSDSSFQAGIEIHEIDGAEVRIFSAAKTLVDCFRFRKNIGMDVFLEALHMYRRSDKFNLGSIRKMAQDCQVEELMRPYLETVL